MAQVNEEIWQKAIDYFVVGMVVNGVVYKQVPYGFFIELKHPEIEDTFVGLVSVTEFRDSAPVKMSDFPKIGTTVQAIVLGHRSHNHQIWIGMKESYFLQLETSP